MALSSGTRLGSFEILAPLGAGGMGEVYRAHDSRLGRDVAIKILPSDLASSPDRLARFEREAKTVAGLNHPNIVTLYTIEEAGGLRFLVMELVEGHDLSSMIVPGGLPLGQLLDMAIALADALVAAHEKRVVHRDLKPANVMLTRNGRVKVLDFGLAKLTEIGADLELTRATSGLAPISQAGTIVGTAPYMSPEQIRGEEVDARTDLFSFGILIHELATGARPFLGQTVADVSSAILRDQAPSLASLRADMPPRLEQLLHRCLEKVPRERVQTALDVANELRSIKRTLEGGSSSSAKASPEQVASIAVLPFVNRSASAEDEYFSDGLADELLNVLAKIKGIRVIARASAFQFKGKNEDLPTIGRKLNVRTVLDGSVRKAGNRIRVSVQLVNVTDSSPLWSETYDRTLDDIFAVQDDIARSVVKELRTALLGVEPDSNASGELRAEVAQAAVGRGTNPEAHRLYLLALHLLRRTVREDSSKAIEYLQQALTLDPHFAMAWARISTIRLQQANFGWLPRAEALDLAIQAAHRALEIAPTLAHAQSSLILTSMYRDLDWRGALAARDRALELGPKDPAVLISAAMLAACMGDFDHAVQWDRAALELDPLSPSAHANLGLVLYEQGRLTEAEVAFRKQLEVSPRAFSARASLACVLVELGRMDEALAVAKQESGEPQLWALALVHHARGEAAESQRSLEQLIERDAPYQVAQIYAVRGEKDAAFEWLERAFPGGWAIEAKASRLLRSLHSDPRWPVFVKKLGLESDTSSNPGAPR